MTHTGGCFCGQVRYTIDAEPTVAVTCWCRDCQYIASGSGTNNVCFPEEAVTFEGEITEIEKTAYSGNIVRRGFCPKCGSQLYARNIKPAGMLIRIRAGTLDNTELMAPQFVAWTDSAPKWALLDPDIPHFPRQPTASEVGVKG